jgi:hypothetical protein
MRIITRGSWHSLCNSLSQTAREIGPQPKWKQKSIERMKLNDSNKKGYRQSSHISRPAKAQKSATERP